MAALFSQIGDVFGAADYHTGLGLFFDTYSNHNGPHNVSIAFMYINSLPFPVIM